MDCSLICCVVFEQANERVRTDSNDHKSGKEFMMQTHESNDDEMQQKFIAFAFELMNSHCAKHINICSRNEASLKSTHHHHHLNSANNQFKSHLSTHKSHSIFSTPNSSLHT